MFSTKAALCAAAIVTASSATQAQATYFTYVLKFGGVGERVSQTRTSPEIKFENLQGATLQFDADVIDGATSVGVISPFTYFAASVVGNMLSFNITNEPGQSSFNANGNGTACLQGSGFTFPTNSGQFQLGCGGISYQASSRAGYSEKFEGTLTYVSVSRQEGSPHDYFSVVGYAPEPSTWALMLAGFGMVGYALRRRPRFSYAT